MISKCLLAILWGRVTDSWVIMVVTLLILLLFDNKSG